MNTFSDIVLLKNYTELRLKLVKLKKYSLIGINPTNFIGNIFVSYLKYSKQTELYIMNL